MSQIKWFNNLLFIENLLGIYRSYYDQTKIKKRFIIFQAFTQIMFNFIVLIGEIILLQGEDYTQTNLIYGCFFGLTFMNYVSYVMTGIRNSCAFMSYYRSISRVSERFNDDTKLINYINKKIHWISIILILSNIAFAGFRCVEVLIKFCHANPLFLSTFLLSQIITRLNIIVQHLILFTVIMLVVRLLKSLTLLVLAAQKSVGSCDITREQIHEWVDLYRDLANCCEKVTPCFGRQFFFTLTVSVTHYIFTMYQLSNAIAITTGDTAEFRELGLAICVYLLLMLMPIVAGQLAHNQGVKFHRVLARLHNTRIIDSHKADVKLIKDFIRLIKKNPIEIKLLPKVPAGMYMLPVILSLAVNFIIVMLQFNHII